MEAKAQEQSARATGLTTWAHINMTVLRQRNAKTLQKQWIKGRRKLEKMELNDIPKLIQKTRKFDNTNEVSQYNLDRMVQMQDDAADRDQRHRKTHCHMYGGVLGPVWQDPGEPEEFNESLPCI